MILFIPVNLIEDVLNIGPARIQAIGADMKQNNVGRVHGQPWIDTVGNLVIAPSGMTFIVGVEGRGGIVPCRLGSDKIYLEPASFSFSHKG